MSTITIAGALRKHAGHSGPRNRGVTMNFFDVVKKRRSIRSFLPAPIAEEDLRRILDAANAAPSAGKMWGPINRVIAAAV